MTVIVRPETQAVIDAIEAAQAELANVSKSITMNMRWIRDSVAVRDRVDDAWRALDYALNVLKS